ncbi:MAG: translocation/assembly module TamB domain-containing protein [Vicinamibacterales bacterium]
MRALRRLLQVIAVAGTLMIGIMAVALMVSQTPWFKDWLRRYIVRESKQYLNGELSIGGLGGNLFFGVQLTDVALDMSGQRVVSVKALEIDYSVIELISTGIVLNEIKLNQPSMRVERDASGSWNLARLVKAQKKEAEREGPGRPISLSSIEVTDATVSLADAVGTSGLNLPEQLDDVDIKGSFKYAPVHYSVDLEHLSFRGKGPELAVSQAAGRIAVRDDNIYIEQMSLATAESSVRVDGVIEHYLKTPVMKLTAAGQVSLPEIGRLVPAAAGYKLHPAFEIRANGPAERLNLDLNVRSEAGNLTGQVIANVQGPAMGAAGKVNVDRLNLAPILRDASQRSDITGQAQIDVEVAATPHNAPFNERLAGTFTFAGARVVAAGYQARDVRVKGAIAGRRIELDGRAVAYGGTATAKGFIVTPTPGARVSYDLRGSANGVNLRNLPASTGAPVVTTSLSVASYHVRGEGSSVSGEAELNRSTVEGATIGDGTFATFALTPRTISYSSRGSVEDLDVERIGRAFTVAAIAKPEYASRLTGTFDVTGSQPRSVPGRRQQDSSIAEMTLDATGMLKNSAIMGGNLPELGFEAHMANGALAGKANGRFEGFDPARILSRPEAKGTVTGTVNAEFNLANLAAPVTPDSVTASGQLTLAPSTIGGLEIDSAAVDGAYRKQVGDLKQFTLSGPDVKANAAGRVALDRTSSSKLNYHVEAANIQELAKLAGQTQVAGSAIVDGALTGNAASLVSTGTIDGSNISYGENNALDVDSKFTVSIPELEFAKAHVEATTHATFIKAGSFQLNELTATTTYDNQRVQFTTNVKEQTRELAARGEVILHADHQEIHLPEFSVRTQGVEWRTAPGSRATVRYGQNRIALQNVRLVSAAQSLDIDGTIALGGEAPSGALEVKAHNVDVQQLEALLLQNRGFGGQLSASAKLTGTMDAPSVDGHVEIQNGTFKTYKYEALVADVGYTGNRMTVDATLRQSPAEQIMVKGSAPRSLFTASSGGHTSPGPGDEVDLHVTSTAMNLAVVQGFTDLVANVTGTLQADVRVTGSGADPHVVGFVDIRKGAFGVPLAGGSYTGLDTRIDLAPDAVRLQEFQILDEHGRSLRVHGELAIHEKQVGAVNIKIESDNFELIDNEIGDLGVASSLTVTGELRRPKIAGQVRLQTGRIEVDRLLQFFYDPYATESMPEVISAERAFEGSGSAQEATAGALKRAQTGAVTGAEEAPTVAPAPTGAFAAMALDVRLLVPDNLVIRGKDLRPGGPTGAALGNMNATVGGEIEVRKSAGAPITLFGTVTPVRGTYEFQGRRFDLVRGGQVRFIGETKIDPILDLSATRTIPNTGVEARVRVTGTLTAPELTLSSSPPLEESDILALIVFNRPVNELGTGERSSLAATAGGIATGFIAAPLGESIGRALDLDLFEITTSTDEGDFGAGLTLGQQLGDKAFLRLRQQFGERNTTEFMLEYRLSKFLRLEATAAPETSGSANRLNQRRVERGGLDLIFFFSY